MQSYWVTQVTQKSYNEYNCAFFLLLRINATDGNFSNFGNSPQKDSLLTTQSENFIHRFIYQPSHWSLQFSRCLFRNYIWTAKEHTILACSVKIILQKPRRSHGIFLRAKPRSFFLFYFSRRARICLGSIQSKATKRSTTFPPLAYTRSDAASASNGQERR